MQKCQIGRYFWPLFSSLVRMYRKSNNTPPGVDVGVGGIGVDKTFLSFT